MLLVDVVIRYLHWPHIEGDCCQRIFLPNDTRIFFQESKLSYEHLRRQVDETMSEKEQYINSANDAAKVQKSAVVKY